MNKDGAETTKKFLLIIDKCPACGSKERFFESIAKELKAEGKAPENWNAALDAKRGIVSEPQRFQIAAMGTIFPSYYFETDICMGCGNIYVTKLERGEGKKIPEIIQPLIQSNRAERRQFEKMGGNRLLGRNTPFLG